MSEVIAYAIEKTPKGFTRIKIGKSVEELKDSKTNIERMCTSKKTPDGKVLRSCIFHSYCSQKEPGIETMYDFCLEGVKNYAFCTDTYQVYDLCYLDAIKIEEEKNKYANRIMEKTNKYDHHMSVTYRIHEEFMINIEKRKQLMTKKEELQKLYGESDKMEDSPEYSVLFQILQKAQEGYEFSKKNLENIYKLRSYDISKEQFVGQHIKDDTERVEKAKASLVHWINKNQKKSLSQGQELILGLEIQIKNLNKILNSTYETPAVYIHKAIKALLELEHYYKKDCTKQDFYKKVCNDLEVCNKLYKIYTEFIQGIDINIIIDKVDKEQLQAAAEERKVKQSNYIQTAKTGSKGFVVKRDGTVVQDDSDAPKLIIGKMITGKIEDEQWRNLRR